MFALENQTKWYVLPLVFVVLTASTSGCYIFNFLDDDSSGGGGGASSGASGGVHGQSLGDRAGGADEEALAAVYAVTSDHSPAAIRPDPDLFVRRMLREYRDEGATVARQIGRVEQFRLLLGGASEDFTKVPQESYDATSLLAVFKVAEEVCRGLVAPNEWEHDGWSTILPHGVDEERENILWLAQRFLGRHSSSIESTIIDDLIEIMETEEPHLVDEWWASGNAFAKYVPVCATLALDAEAMYL